MESRPFLFVNRLELGDGFGRIARTETHLSRCRPLKNPSSVASAALKNLSVEHVLFTKRLNHVCGQTPSLSYEIETQSLAGLHTVQIADKELKGSSFVCLCLQQNPQRGNYPARVFLRLHTFANGETQMKALVIAIAVVVGGIQLGFTAFDAGVASAEQSQVAQSIKARQAL